MGEVEVGLGLLLLEKEVDADHLATVLDAHDLLQEGNRDQNHLTKSQHCRADIYLISVNHCQYI